MAFSEVREYQFGDEDVYKRQVHEALKRAGVTKEELSAVAFTRGPGLMGSLLVDVYKRQVD